MKSLDLGCGPRSKKEGSIGLDKRPAPHVDVVHDLNSYPYPFRDNEFDCIEMSHIIEHVEKPLLLLNEVHRITKHGGTVHIITPHYSAQNSYGDFEHLHHFGYITFRTLQTTGLFRISKLKLQFPRVYRMIGVGVFANLLPQKWERYLSFVLPAVHVEVFLEVIKPRGEPDLLMKKYMY